MNKYITAQQILQGVPVSTIDRLKLMSADEWKKFTEEWLDLKNDIKDKINYIEFSKAKGFLPKDKSNEN